MLFIRSCGGPTSARGSEAHRTYRRKRAIRVKIEDVAITGTGHITHDSVLCSDEAKSELMVACNK